MATPNAGLAAATPRKERFRLLIGGPAPDPTSWQLAHLVLLTLVFVSVPAVVVYLGAAGHPPILWPALTLLLVGAAVPAWLPRRVRSCLMALALGLLIPVFVALPLREGVFVLAVAAAYLLVGLYRDWLPWLLTVAASATVVLEGAATNPARTFGPGTPPVDTGALADLAVLFAGMAALSMGVLLALAQLRAQARQAHSALSETRRILQAVSSAAGTAETLESAAAVVLDAVCDDKWPIGHLYLVREGRFASSQVWSTLAREQYPRVVAATGQMIANLPTQTHKLGAAVAIIRGPAWSSAAHGSPEVGPLGAEDVTPRARALRESGIATVTGCPVLVDGKIVAVIELDSTAEFTEAPDELETVRLIASLLSRVAERERSLRELRESAELLSILERAVPDAVVMFDLATHELLEYSDNADLLGLGEADRGRDVRQLASLRQVIDPAAASPDLLAGRAARMSLTRGEGSVPQPVEVYFYPSTLRGRDVGVVLARDVTEREAAARALAAASSRARALLELADTGIYEVDAAGAIRYANAEGARLLGVGESSELLGATLPELVPFLGPVLVQAREAGHGSPVVRRSGRLVVAGVPHPVSVAVTLLADGPDGGHAIVTLSDVTAAERAARLATQRAHALEINDTVVQGVSTALYGLEMGEIDTAVSALDSTLSSAKQTIAALLSDAEFSPELLHRRQAARVAPAPLEQGEGS